MDHHVWSHTKGFVALVLATIVLSALEPPGMALQLGALLVLVSILGVPHGALDLNVARAFWPLHGLRADIAFVAAYLGLAGVMLVFWLLAPGWALMAFLAYSALHFSDDWQGEMGLSARLMAGGVVIGGPLLFSPDEVTAIFTFLAPANAASLAVHVGGWVAIAAITGFVITALWSSGRSSLTPGVAEIAAIMLAAWALPPLVYFALYFCLLHSPRHFWRTSQRLGLTQGAALLSALPLTAITLAAAGLVALFLLGSGETPDGAVLSVVFITLSALTVPHMILVDRFNQQREPLHRHRTA